MTRLTYLIRALFAASLLLVGGQAHAQGPAGGEASTACTHTFTKGTGDARLSYCVNEHANLMSFSAAGVEHIRVGAFVDGYVVCTGDGYGPTSPVGYDAGAGGESAWGANALISGPTTTGVGYSRTTADGTLRVDHTFTMDTAEGDVTVTVKLTNSGFLGLDLDEVAYVRFSDFDAGGSFTGDLWTSSRDEVEAVDGRGISLNAISFNTLHRTAIAGPNHVNACDEGGLFGDEWISDGKPNGTVGDYVAYVRYDIGALTPGQSKTIKFVYKRK